MGARAIGYDLHDKFLKGLIDTFVLVSFVDHVLLGLWDGEVRIKKLYLIMIFGHVILFYLQVPIFLC